MPDDTRLESINGCRYVTLAEAAEFLSVSSSTLRYWDRAGKLRAERDPKSGNRIYKHEDLITVSGDGGQGATEPPPVAPKVELPTGLNEHFVQFYQSDEFLMDSVCRYISSAVSTGDAGLVIATRPHRQGIEQRLRRNGVDLARLGERGQYVALDAASTLAKFMVNGMPSGQRFNEVMGDTVRKMSADGRRLCAFGEMVALLWKDGHRAAAVKLEELWNELAKIQPLTLFCAYPSAGFGAKDELQHSQICSAHSWVLPTESYSNLTNDRDRLAKIAELEHRAQMLEAEIAHRKEVEKSLACRQRELDQLVECERAARTQAERAGRIKDEFLATLSHELRTPLSAICGWTHIISQSPTDRETVVHGIEVIDRNVRAQTQLIEDLLDMSRIISGKLQLEMQSVDLAAVVRAAIEAVRPSAENKLIRIREHVAVGIGPVTGDPNRLQQVVWNLLSNSVKFTPRAGTIDVSLLRKHGHYEITVADTGQGIAASFIPHIFERFSQADSSAARKHGGLGIGLSIVKQLIELHGGSISVQSEGEGRGATFRVLLPQETQRAKPPEKTAHAEERGSAVEPVAARLRGASVLVVDDDADARVIIARLLGDFGAKVVTASCADEGMELLGSAKRDLLISDIGMPGRDGHDFIRDVRDRSSASYNRIPAMALTAFARPEDRTRALVAGFQVHIAKPIEPRELIVAAASLVRDDADR
jgi:signal transduction histidine kinase/ActR/RegA family two-component response regulator